MRSLVVLVVGAGAAAAVPNHVVLVGGNLTLDGRSVSLARYDPERRSWAAAYTSKLYADAADARAAGVIRAVAANGSREVFLGGRFDATSADAQALYCGVGRLVDRGPNDGARLERVGDGAWCARVFAAQPTTIRALAVRGALLYAGGRFASEVWDGSRFAPVRHVARFDSNRNAWLPLRGGRLGSADDASVNALAFCDDQLLILGRFGTLAGKALASPNVAVYEPDAGLAPDAAGGFVFASGAPAAVDAVAVDQAAGVAYVAGRYDAIVPGGLPCAGVAAKPFREAGHAWRCVADPAFAFEPGSVELLHAGARLFAAGAAAINSSWAAQSPRRVAVAVFAAPPSRRRLRRGRGNATVGSEVIAASAWQWLAGWRGVDGAPRALAAVAGDAGAFQLVVAGAFDDAPPVAVWTEDARLGPYQSQGGQALRGVATAGAAVVAARGAGSHAAAKPKPRDDVDAGLALVVEASLIGLWLGAAALLVALAAALIRRCWPARKPRLNNLRDGISLATLTGDTHNQFDVEFGDAYRAAMKARHLRDAHALVLIDPAEIVLRDVIGEGSFGRVWSATWQSSEVAVKEFVLAQAAFAGGSLQRRDIVEAIVGEAGIMAYLRHPKVLQLYGCALTAQAIWIVSELCAHGSLRQVLDDDKVELSVETRLRMAIDVAEGMLFLHTRERPIVHRDLKSHNLFVADVRGRLRVRIGDWGSAPARNSNESRTRRRVAASARRRGGGPGRVARPRADRRADSPQVGAGRGGHAGGLRAVDDARRRHDLLAGARAHQGQHGHGDDRRLRLRHRPVGARDARGGLPQPERGADHLARGERGPAAAAAGGVPLARRHGGVLGRGPAGPAVVRGDLRGAVAPPRGPDGRAGGGGAGASAPRRAAPAPARAVPVRPAPVRAVVVGARRGVRRGRRNDVV